MEKAFFTSLFDRIIIIIISLQASARCVIYNKQSFIVTFIPVHGNDKTADFVQHRLYALGISIIRAI